MLIARNDLATAGPVIAYVLLTNLSVHIRAVIIVHTSMADQEQLNGSSFALHC